MYDHLPGRAIFTLAIAPRGGKEVGVPPQDPHEVGFVMGRQVFIRNWKSAKQCKLKHKIYTCVEVRAKHQQGSGNYREDHDSYFFSSHHMKHTNWP